LVNIYRIGLYSVFTQKDYLSQVLEFYIEGFLKAFGAILKVGKTFQFIEDGNSAYSHKSTTNLYIHWRAFKDIVLFYHLAISPDINPIEKYWRRIKQILHRRQRQSTNEAEIIAAVYKEWDNIPQE